MSMSRADALVYLSSRMNSVFEQAQRTTTDTSDGYAPAIDAALLMVGATRTDDLSTYTVPSESIAAFQSALRYQAWDIALDSLAMIVDQQVDAPLTNIKASQAYRNAKERRSEALADLAAFGLGPSQVNWIRWNLDHLEPAGSSSRQWG